MKSSAIYITNNFIRFTQVGMDKKTASGEYQLDISSLKKEELPHHLSAFLKENKISIDNLTLYIRRNQVAVRYLNLPSVDDREIERMLEHKLSNLFPYKPEELVFDQAVIQTKPDGYSQLMLVVVQREVVLAGLSLLKQADLVPDTVDISTISLFNQFCQQKKEQADYLLVNLEDDFLDIIVVRRGKLSSSRGVDIGQEEQSNRLIKEVREIIDIEKVEGISVDKIIISGRGVNLEELAQALNKASLPEVEVDTVACVTRGVTLSSKPNILKINLLPEEHKIQKTIFSRRRLVLYLITLLLLNASLVANILFLKIREKQAYLNTLKSEIRKIEDESLFLEKNMLRIQLLNSHLKSVRLSLGLMTEVYRIAPAGINISSLDISGQSPSGVLILTGLAEDRAAVLKFASLIRDSSLTSKADINYMRKKRMFSKEVIDFEIRSSF